MGPASDGLILRGRCRSGRRWFWAAKDFDGEQQQGWAESEEEAQAASERAVEELAAGRRVDVMVRAGVASQALQELNAAARKALPSTATDAVVVEYLYGIDTGGEHNDFRRRIAAFPITKKTPKRIYYSRDGDRIGYVNRQKIEESGSAYTAAGWWCADACLHLEPPDLMANMPKRPDVGELKALMAAAHPDRGGTDAEFIAARERYDRAKGVA